MRAVGGEPGEQASIEVLNFLVDKDEARGGGSGWGEEEAGGDRPGSRASGGCSRGYGDDFDESRSAVVFRDWFTAEQQQVCVYFVCVCVYARVLCYYFVLGALRKRSARTMRRGSWTRPACGEGGCG